MQTSSLRHLIHRFTHTFTWEGVYFSIADTLYWVYLGAFAVAQGASSSMVALITRLPGAISGLLLPFVRNIHYVLHDETRVFRIMTLTGLLSMLAAIMLLFIYPQLSIIPSIILFLTGQIIESSSNVLVHTFLKKGDGTYLGYRQGVRFFATLIALLLGSLMSSLIPTHLFYGVLFSTVLLIKLLDVRESFLLPSAPKRIMHPLTFHIPRGDRLALLFFAFSSMMGATIMGSLLPSYRLAVLNIPLTMYPFFFFLFLSGVTLASPLWGVFAETYGLRSLFFIGLFLKSLAVLPWAVTDQLPILFTAEVLSGFATAAIGLAITLYTIHLTTSDEERLSYRMQVSTVFSLATLTGLGIVWLAMNTPVLHFLFRSLSSILSTPHQEAFAFSILLLLFTAPFVLLFLPQVRPAAATPHILPRPGMAMREFILLAFRIHPARREKNTS